MQLEESGIKEQQLNSMLKRRRNEPLNGLFNQQHELWSFKGFVPRKAFFVATFAIV